MKLLRKINKGVILSILVLAILITYIVCLEIGRNKEKDKIQEICEKYLAFEDKYTILPKEYQSFANKISQEKLNEYKEEMAKELKKLMVDNEKIYELQKTIIEDKIDTQIQSYQIFTSKNSKLVKISQYEFENDQVTVTVDNSMETEFSTLDDIDGVPEKNEKVQNKTYKIQDTITLKKENGTWKIIYANVGMIEDVYSNYYQTEVVL